eukprot:174655-Rhodomonas_salina.1
MSTPAATARNPQSLSSTLAQSALAFFFFFVSYGGHADRCACPTVAGSRRNRPTSGGAAGGVARARSARAHVDGEFDVNGESASFSRRTLRQLRKRQ